ncbi:MAG: hypothetical protein WCR67_00810 [Bacilli bacterium]
MTFSKILFALYRDYHLDKGYFVKAFHLSADEIVRWEKGISYPDEKQLLRLSEIFSLPIKVLRESIKSEVK